MTEVNGIEVFNWNPPRPVVRGRLGNALPKFGRINNFGDVLGPVVVKSLAGARPSATPRRLLAVGSILHFASDGDVVWGSGVNGKISLAEIRVTELDVRAVRGPLTRQVLLDRKIHVPEIYGDPGLLAPSLLGIKKAREATQEITALPNLHDISLWRRRTGFLDPRRPYRVIIETIARSKLVVTSSLHGAVIADALQVPVALVRPSVESAFKYEDYYEGTGRSLPPMSDGFDRALESPAPPLVWDPADLLEAFPRDPWRA
jgi:pyruvyltransferase